MAPHVVIAGLGLIGGSLGQALRWAGWRVSFVDPAVSMKQARAAGAADEKLDQLDGDLIVLSTPLDAALRLLGELHGSKALITSTCSMMEPLRAAAKGMRFVAGHPFAGSEKSGLTAGSAGLFLRKPWFVERDEPEIRAMINAVGSRQIVIKAGEHDRNMALGSHLPQVISTALASILADMDPLFVGRGAHSVLRLAASPYDIWQPVLEHNQLQIRRAADELCKRMRELDGDDFDRANKFSRESGEPRGR